MFVDNRGNCFVARKKSLFIQLKHVSRLEFCDFGLSPLPMQTAFLKLSLGIKSLFVDQIFISDFLLHILLKVLYYIYIIS